MPVTRAAIRTAKNLEQKSYMRLLNEVIGLVETGRTAAGRAVNHTITATYWLIGRQIVEHEQGGSRRADYGEELIARLSIALTKRFGRGFSMRNLEQMRLFFTTWPIPQTVSAESHFPRNSSTLPIPQTVSAEFKPGHFPSFPLPWSHYVRLLSIRDRNARAYYECEAVRGGWSVRQLDRQISTLAYQRTRGRSQSRRGEEASANEIIRDPFVLEFLGLKDEYSENELEDALIRELEQFLLELGTDFTFVARQKRLRVGDEWYRIDLLLFHRRLRCLVIVDLKIGKFTHADAGQMNLYLNYAHENWTHAGENPPVGLILCSERDGAVAHYALGNLGKKILAREYQLALPKASELQVRLKKARHLLGKAIPAGERRTGGQPAKRQRRRS
ncbi:MAG: DUF1016 domain-containing protein [Acidobacteria bacterium]|nr:DUF1016 domain-containing protein [Acidobacteriota bacterium]